MNMFRSPFAHFADELERRAAPKTDDQLEREATLALRDLRERGAWDRAKRVCTGCMVFVEEHETGVRYVDARRVK